VTNWAQSQCFPEEHDRLVEVSVIASVLEAGKKHTCKVIQ
jgi:hypothetical protein